MPMQYQVIKRTMPWRTTSREIFSRSTGFVRSELQLMQEWIHACAQACWFGVYVVNVNCVHLFAYISKHFYTLTTTKVWFSNLMDEIRKITTEDRLPLIWNRSHQHVTFWYLYPFGMLILPINGKFLIQVSPESGQPFQFLTICLDKVLRSCYRNKSK